VDEAAIGVWEIIRAHVDDRSRLPNSLFEVGAVGLVLFLLPTLAKVRTLYHTAHAIFIRKHLGAICASRAGDLALFYGAYTVSVPTTHPINGCPHLGDFSVAHDLKRHDRGYTLRTDHPSCSFAFLF
jgi:hypothetical protein